jgi:hypothetical protein
MFKKEINAAIWGLFLISLGGLLIHIKIHLVSVTAFNWIPVIFGIISTIFIPVMFNYQKTWRWAYLFNWAAVITGAVTMAYWSLTAQKLSLSFYDIFVKSTFADIVVLMSKLSFGQIIMAYWLRNSNKARQG